VATADHPCQATIWQPSEAGFGQRSHWSQWSAITIIPTLFIARVMEISDHWLRWSHWSVDGLITLIGW